MNNSTLIGQLDRLQRYATIAGVTGILVCIIAAFFVRAEVFQAYWFAWVYWSGLSLGALSLLMLVFLTPGAWSNAVQRPAEAAATTIPLMGLLLIPAFFSMGDIFEWARPGAFAEHHWPHKERYLTVGWFAVRTVIVFVIVSALMATLRYLGWLAEQRTRFLRPTAYLGGVSGLGMVTYSVCMVFATTDWVMSLQPDWYSTMFSVIFMIGGFLAALALAIGVMTLVNRGESLAGFLSTKQFHDLGNLLLAFVIFWMYVAFSQFLLIWSGNLPREIVWYLKRRSGGWEYVALMLAIFQFAVPFALLLSRAAKRHPQTLGTIAWLVFAASVLNVYWMVIPTFHHGAGDAFWLSAVAFVGIGGIWSASFLWLLKRRPILPLAAMQSEEHHG